MKIGKDEDYGIYRRLERGKNPVFLVMLKRQGLRLSKRFAVSVHCSEEAALQSAREWRNRVLALLPPMTSRQLRTLTRKNNISGIPGVYRCKKSSGAAYWVARGESGDRKMTKSFRVDLHGEDGAKQLAIEARRQFLQTVQSTYWVASETALDAAKHYFGDPAQVCVSAFLAEHTKLQEFYLARLYSAGLIGKTSCPAVQRRHYSRQYPLWEATYVTGEGKRIMRRFSVAKYGEEKAKSLAQQAYETLKMAAASKKQSAPESRLSEQVSKHPVALLDTATRHLALKNDAALSRALGVWPSMICNIRRGHLTIGPNMLVRILEATDLSLRDLHRLIQSIACEMQPDDPHGTA